MKSSVESFFYLRLQNRKKYGGFGKLQKKGININLNA